MFRIKLIVLLAVIVSALVAAPLALTSRVEDQLLVDAEEQLKSSNEVVRLASSVHGYSVQREAFEVAHTASIVAGVTCPDTPEELAAARAAAQPGPDGAPAAGPATNCTQTRHDAVLQALKSWNGARQADRDNNQLRYLSERDSGFAMPRQPDLLIVADADGVVVARVGFDKDDWFGPSKPRMNTFAAVARTELGLTQRDLIVWREHPGAAPTLAHIGAAPINAPDGTFLGSAVVGYFVTDTAAEEAIQLLYGIDVAYFFRGDGNQVSYAGSTASTRPQFLQGMANAQFTRGEDTPIGFAELALQHEGAVYRFEHAGNHYMAMSTALSKDESGTSVQSGFVVVTSTTAAVAPLSRFRKLLPLLGAAFLLIGALAVLVAIKEFMVPIEEISKGIQEVIAGNSEYMWEVDEKSHLSDLAHSLNVMSARLQGKKDPDSDEVEGEEDWNAMAGGGSGERKAPAGVSGVGGIRGRSVETADDEDEA